jgi:excisionase family DNA binding protein
MRSNEIVGKRLLNVQEAAKYLGLQIDTVYKKSRLRELPSVKVGRALRFDVMALQRFIEEHTIETIWPKETVYKMSIHKERDGIYRVRWREGGRNRSIRVHGSHELARRSNARKCRLGMKTGTWM